MKWRICLIILLFILFFLVWRLYVDRQFVDFDCLHFETQAEAQKVFEEYDYDKYGLDANRNGIACEILP